MITHMYSIYDTAVAAYQRPFFLQTDAQAIREFGDIFDGDNPISKHPEHYTLCRLGSFNDQTGKTKGSDHIETLITGLEVIAIKNQNGQTNFDNISEISAGGTG